jgi:hypothetical protein
MQCMCQIFQQDVQVQVKNGNTLVEEVCDSTRHAEAQQS